MKRGLYNTTDLKRTLSAATGIALYMLFLIIGLKLYEIFSIQTVLTEQQSLVSLFFKSLFADFAGVSRPLLVLFLLAFILPHKWTFLSRTLIFILGLSSMILVISSSFFYINASVPLDESVFLYSFEEVILTIKANNFSIWFFLIQLLFLLSFSLTFIYSNFQKKSIAIVLASLLVLGLGLYPLSRTIMKKEFNLATQNFIKCKSDYFIFRSFLYLKEPSKKIVKDEAIIATFLKHRVEDGFIQPEDLQNNELKKELSAYPFLHTNSYNPLNNYIKKSSEHPNIVFILVESLDARVFKELAQKKYILTPFLNSIKEKSLYWNQCYSTTERTFGVLPAVLGSLPMGQEGFNEAYPIPLHKSVISVLKDSGYQTNFFYGGWVGFQKMSNFLSYQPIHHLYNTYPDEYQTEEEKASWGVRDDLVFKHSFNVLDSINKSPFLNIYLTLSTHVPYILPHLEQLKAQMKKLNAHLPPKALNKVLEKQYLSLLYLDNSIKQLIEGYKAKGWFDNTLFIITGDHSMHSIFIKNHLQNYAVPLMIYGSLVKEAKVFNNPVSHLDIAPSLYNLMDSRHWAKKDSVFHCLALGLDTAKTRTRNVFIPFMTNNREIYACLYNDYFFHKGDLYEILEDNYLKPLDNKVLQNKLKERLETYNYINEYTVHSNMIYSIHYCSKEE